MFESSEETGFLDCIAGMEIDMQGSILGIKSMGLVCITLRTGTVTKGHGTRGANKGMGHTHFEMGRQEVVNGTVAISKLHYPQ